MDVGCPKCQTEYELDDSRVPEEGVTVKCTTCGHVFRVKKKSLVVTLPVREGEAHHAQSMGELPPAPPSREWKIRQPGGNVYACRELTTLQKWIIEGKVSRDDEISLSGETWKRLGNIPELASFFQVFDEAKKARAMDALDKGKGPAAVGNETLPGVGGGPKATETWKEPNFAIPPPVGGPGREEPEVSGSAPNIRETIREPQFSLPPPAPGPSAVRPPPPPPQSTPRPFVAPAPATFRRKAAAEDDDDDELQRAVKGGGRGKWVVLVLLGLAMGGGAGWYFGLYLPEQKALEEALNRPPDPTPTPVAVVLPPEPVEVVDAGAAAIDAGAAVELDAGAADAGSLEVDAGSAAPDAGAASVDAGEAKPEPKRTYEYLLSQGDRLRDREKPEQALDFYGQAHELKPNRVEPVTGRGLALLDMGNYPAAASSFESALKLSSKYGPAIMGLAEAYRLQGKNAQAVEYYQRYLDVLPTGAEAAVARNNIERLKK